MNKRYLIGIIITVLVLGVNQFFIQYTLNQKRFDANTINVAGKQRMLSQRITAEFYAINQKHTTPTLLQQLFQEWKDAHKLLEDRLTKSALLFDSDESAKNKLESLDKYFNYIGDHISLSNSSEINLISISANQNDYLQKMDAVVKRLEVEADKKLDYIIWIEYLLFFLALAVLILEVFFIYRPIEKELKTTGASLAIKNKELTLAVEKIKSKNRDIKDVIYITAHDLQEPIKTVSSMVDIFNSSYQDKLDEEGLSMLNFLSSATDRMSGQVKDLLDYSVLGAHKKLSIVNCNELLRNVKDDLQASITSEEAQIQYDILPTFYSYPTELRLLFQNLISNALKFRRKEAPPVIGINAVEQEDTWQFQVSDNGIGIDIKDQEKVFSIFQRLHKREDYAGTGIGLSYCKKIVELHNGKIWVSSELGNGSTFYFTISKDLGNFADNLNHE